MIFRHSRIGCALSPRAGKGLSSQPAGEQAACVVTCHNYGRFLAQCLDSCLRQTIPFSHIIVVDDASTDETRDVAAKFAGQGVRYLRTEFRNYSLARNAGYKALPPASHVLFVDADNWLADNYVEVLRRGFVNSNIGACYGNLLHHRNNRTLGLSESVQAYKEGWLEQANMADACSLMRCDAFEQAGLWSEAGTVMSDWSLWLRFRRMGWKMQFCPEAILNYRIHDRQMSVAWRTDPMKVVEAAPKESALIAIVTLFSGRTWALRAYARVLRGLQWNRRNIVVVAVDNSGNPAFNTQLETVLRDSGCVHVLVPDATRAVADVPSERFAGDSRLRQQHNHRLAVQMARLYAIARQFVPAATTHVWTIEDDIEPPPDALKHLMFGLYRFRRAGMIGGLARSRFGKRWIAWDDGKPFEAPSLGDYKEATETGFTCALFPRSVWDALAFRPGPGVPEGNVAYDHTACRDIRNMGRQVLISGSVRCKHWQQDGTFV
ncbi:MAG: glycosyltransferase [Verrucomicrobiia bacterium]